MVGESNDDVHMLAAAQAALSLFDAFTADSVQVTAANQMRFRAAWPCICQAVMQARAAILLLRAGLPFPASSNARSAFEHAMMAQWILLTRGAELAVVNEVKRKLRAMTRDVATFIELPSDLQPGPPVSSHSGPAKSFERLCDRFSPPSGDSVPNTRSRQKALYTLYRNLSEAVHPSVGTWQQYFEWDSEGSPSLRVDGDDSLGADTTSAIALSAFLALGALEQLRHGQPRLAEVSNLSQEYGLPFDLRGDDQEPALQP